MTRLQHLLFAATLVASATAASRPPSGFYQLMAEAMQRMMGAMHVRPTGSVDRDFAAMMIPHHQGAIDMAKVVLQYGKDDKVKSWANQIIAAQEKEIAEMQDWLKAHGE